MEHVFQILPRIAKEYEVIIVNDVSTDNTGDILATLQRTFPLLRIITHTKNKGYGGALSTGFSHAKMDFIFYTDGDGQYDVKELKLLIERMDNDIDMVTGFKIERRDTWIRKLVGAFYNQIVRLLFQIELRDVDCDFRLFRRHILSGLTLSAYSGAFDAIFIKTLQDKGVRFTEVPVHHYKRPYGSSQFFTLKHVARSLFDIVLFRLKYL